MVSTQLLLFSCLCQNSTHFFCISHYHLQCLQSAIRHKQPATLLCVNSLPDVVRSSQIAAFADDTKVFKEITSTRVAEQLAEKDLGVYITDNLLWNKQVNVQCAQRPAGPWDMYGEKLDTSLVKNITVRRSACLTLVRSHFGYATQVCLDSAVNRPDSKARACPEPRYKVYWIYHSFVTKHIQRQANES